MKKILFAITVGSILALAATNGAYAQNSVNPEVLEPQKNAVAVEKSMPPNGISSRAVKDFTKSYKNVTGETWDKTSEGFSVKFTSDGVRTIIYYKGNGTWMGSLKGYNEDQMPADVRKIVKREYYDYSITYVQEAQTGDSEGKPTYIIHLEDKHHIKLVRVCDGEMDVWKEYKRQS